MPNMNLALGKPATQSSTCEWSGNVDPEADARGANNGLISRKKGFCTDSQKDPWWQVDLQQNFSIRKIILYNAKESADRLRRFSVLTSLNGRDWEVAFRKRDGSTFGAFNDRPFEVDFPDLVVGRFIRIRLDGHSFLHFNECQIFGDPASGDDCALFISNVSQRDSLMLAPPENRNGSVVDIDGFFVFIDTENYGSSVSTAIRKGSYESRERSLVQEVVRPNDRVLEIGTAIGVVTMTLASIVGDRNIVTFDANPDIVHDARENFRRNGFQFIDSKNGVLTNQKNYVLSELEADFYISKEFWASRLYAGESRSDIVKTVKVPVFCLEREIALHGADTLVCDIEGGEVSLLAQAQLAGIKKIIMETHYWAVGMKETDELIRKLIVDGFSIDLYHSANHVIYLRR